MTYEPPRPLRGEDELDGFAARSHEQTVWLRQHARQSAASSLTKVLVVTPTDDDKVVAYYAWTMAQIEVRDAPPRLTKGAGRYPQPVALLARLAVDEAHEGYGLGAALVRDVIERTAAISEEIGCRALLVHAESEDARAFYFHLVPEFDESPTDPLHLVLLLKDIKATLRGLDEA